MTSYNRVVGLLLHKKLLEAYYLVRSLIMTVTKIEGVSEHGF